MSGKRCSPTSQPTRDARDIAVEALSQARPGGPFVRDRLDHLITQRSPDNREASLAEELALGVTRHRLTLDQVLAVFFEGRLTNVNRRLTAVLRVGAYQLIWLDRIPAFAAVDSAVEQAKKIGGAKAAGLVNALLRQIVRHRQDEIVQDAGRIRPCRCIRIDYQRWRAFDVDVLPDPTADLVRHLAAATSHPEGLVRRWLSVHGRTRCEAICLAGGLRPPWVLRVNRLRIDAQGLVERLAEDGLKAVASARAKAVFLEPSASGRIDAIAKGLCQPQDATSQAVVRTAPPQPGQTVLDLCAGPGTKTTQLAEHMRNQGLIVACDRSAEKLAMVQDSCRRMGVTCVQTVLADELDDAVSRYGPFDLVLVDPPCCNSGVLARRPEARYRIAARRLAELAGIQMDLIRRAAECVKPKGKIIYATCSIEPEENDPIVKRFLARSAGWRLTHSRLTLPQAGPNVTDWRDGGFVAVIART